MASGGLMNRQERIGRKEIPYTVAFFVLFPVRKLWSTQPTLLLQ